jgi:ankyrin repeat protein
VPLHHASARGYTRCAQLLIAKGCDVNHSDKSGIACVSGSTMRHAASHRPLALFTWRHST